MNKKHRASLNQPEFYIHNSSIHSTLLIHFFAIWLQENDSFLKKVYIPVQLDENKQTENDICGNHDGILKRRILYHHKITKKPKITLKKFFLDDIISY